MCCCEIDISIKDSVYQILAVSENLHHDPSPPDGGFIMVTVLGLAKL